MFEQKISGPVSLVHGRMRRMFTVVKPPALCLACFYIGKEQCCWFLTGVPRWTTRQMQGRTRRNMTAAALTLCLAQAAMTHRPWFSRGTAWDSSQKRESWFNYVKSCCCNWMCCTSTTLRFMVSCFPFGSSVSGVLNMLAPKTFLYSILEWGVEFFHLHDP